MNKQYLVVYKILHFGRPVKVRAELRETRPCHADMLRYDRAFHDPLDPSRVIFPIRDRPITLARWRSFCLQVVATEEYIALHNAQHWITYQDYDQAPETLEQYRSRTKSRTR